MIQVLLCSLVIATSGVLPGIRLDRVEMRTSGMLCRWNARVSNDGRFLIDWTNQKVLDVWDTRTGEAVVNENVFGCRATSGTQYVLTDSQLGHLRGQVSDLFGAPYGSVLCMASDCFVMGISNPSQARETLIAVVRPKARGLRSNTVLFRSPQPTDDSDYWVYSGSGSAIVAIREKGGILLVRVGKLLGSSPAIESSKRLRLPGHGLTLQDINPRGMQGLFVNRDGAGYVAQIDGARPARLNLPRPMAQQSTPGVLRFVDGHYLATYWTGATHQPLGGGETYLSQPAGKWKRIGPYELVGMSFDKKLVLLQGSDGLWLCPVSKL